MDLQSSIITGVVVGITSLFLLQYVDADNDKKGKGETGIDRDSGRHKDNDKAESGKDGAAGDKSTSKKGGKIQKVEDENTNPKFPNGGADQQKADELFEHQTERLLKKTKDMRKRIGVTDDTVRESLRDERWRGSSTDEGFNIFKVIDKILLIMAIIGLFYYLNKATNGDFMRAVVGIFPKEAETLGVKEYFERVEATSGTASGGQPFTLPPAAANTESVAARPI
jgi:hypothetical protein